MPALKPRHPATAEGSREDNRLGSLTWELRLRTWDSETGVAHPPEAGLPSGMYRRQRGESFQNSKRRPFFVLGTLLSHVIDSESPSRDVPEFLRRKFLVVRNKTTL